MWRSDVMIKCFSPSFWFCLSLVCVLFVRALSNVLGTLCFFKAFPLALPSLLKEPIEIMNSFCSCNELLKNLLFPLWRILVGPPIVGPLCGWGREGVVSYSRAVADIFAGFLTCRQLLTVAAPIYHLSLLPVSREVAIGITHRGPSAPTQ